MSYTRVRFVSTAPSFSFTRPTTSFTDLKLDNIAIRPKDFDKIIELCAARAIPSNHVSAGETGSPPGPCQLSGSGSTKGDPLPPWPSSVFDWVTSVRKIWDRPQGFRKVQWDDPADLEQLGKIDVVLIDVGHCEFRMIDCTLHRRGVKALSGGIGSLAAPDQRHLIQPEGFRAPEVELGSHGVFQSMSDPSAALSVNLLIAT